MKIPAVRERASGRAGPAFVAAAVAALEQEWAERVGQQRYAAFSSVLAELALS